MISLADLTHTHFEDVLHTWFRVHVDGGTTVEVELVEVELLPPIPQFPRRPFRLVFRSRDPNTVLPQATYRFSHEALDELEMFIVPRGPDRERRGMTYDATFS